MEAMTCSTRWLTGAVEPTHGHDAAAALPIWLGLTAVLSATTVAPVAARTITARLPEPPLRQMDEVLVMAMCFLLVTKLRLLTYLCFYKQDNWRRVDVNGHRFQGSEQINGL